MKSKRETLLTYLAEIGAEKLRLDLQFLTDCTAGKREMWSGLAKRLESKSEGVLTKDFWPLIRKGDGARRGSGTRALRNPTWPGYRAFEEIGTNATAYAEASGYSHQELSYWINGDRYVPLDFVRQVERDTKGAVKLADWPLVRDRHGGGTRWRWGVKMAVGETAKISDKPS